MAGPLVSLMILFSGFVIGEKNIPDWLIWAFWLSPFSWSVPLLLHPARQAK